MRDIAAFVGRLLLSAIFLLAGYGKITNFGGTQSYMEMHGLPFAPFFLVCAMLLEMIGGLSLLTGYKARWGALALFLFLIPTTVIFHTDFADPAQMQMFLKNLAIMGGLLQVFSFGPGKYKIGT